MLQEAAARYGVTHLLLDADHPLPLNDLYGQTAIQPGFTLLFARDGYQLYELVP